MANIRAFLNEPGVEAIGQFSDSGDLIDYAGDISLKTAKISALMAYANMASAKMQTFGWSNYTGKEGFEPAIGFSISGSKKTVIVIKNFGVFVNNNEADFDSLYKKLQEI